MTAGVSATLVAPHIALRKALSRALALLAAGTIGSATADAGVDLDREPGAATRGA
jgi:hypothetical protein